ncbi:MAG TPA: flagella biosynthesis chaperone FliJ [Pseudomonas xinjiangensis]|uniref:Flagellar FliJ protein n=2 Tax=root TaxID=1 RepID=A0A7V1FRN9_9GAMM|nr:flagella biosynthesis chaperone FliJ [Halopseudomonas xinjiangensis]HEC49136.1 flagella biosynthesis chaperone FliJ [Halopseudomonas xinjiangensis]
MSESRIRRLEPVVDMALEEERKAASKLGECQKQAEDAEARLRDLDFYCSEYQKGWSQRGGMGVGREWLLNYQRFLAQMQVAIEQQKQTVTWHKLSVDKARDLWKKRYQRLEALRMLIDRYRQEARVRADRQEQKLLDELSQRAFDSRRNTP